MRVLCNEHSFFFESLLTSLQPIRGMVSSNVSPYGILKTTTEEFGVKLIWSSLSMDGQLLKGCNELFDRAHLVELG